MSKVFLLLEGEESILYVLYIYVFFNISLHYKGGHSAFISKKNSADGQHLSQFCCQATSILKVPVVAAGASGTGRQLAAALAMGVLNSGKWQPFFVQRQKAAKSCKKQQFGTRLCEV